MLGETASCQGRGLHSETLPLEKHMGWRWQAERQHLCVMGVDAVWPGPTRSHQLQPAPACDAMDFNTEL